MKLAKFSRILFMGLAASVFSSCSIKNYSERTVSVRGTGSVDAVYDIARIIFSVDTNDSEPSAAAEQNAIKMTAVQDAIIKAGCPKDSIVTQNYSLTQHYNYKQQSYEGYEVRNQVKVTLNDLSLVSKIIDAAISSGANNLSSLSFDVTDTAMAIKQAKTLAVQDAYNSANLIAETAGAKLGKILQIKEIETSNFAPKFQNLAMREMDMEESTETKISSGKRTFSVVVDAVYELK